MAKHNGSRKQLKEPILSITNLEDRPVVSGPNQPRFDAEHSLKTLIEDHLRSQLANLNFAPSNDALAVQVNVVVQISVSSNSEGVPSIPPSEEQRVDQEQPPYEYSRLIKFYRKRYSSKLTQREFGEWLGWSETKISYFERGHGYPPTIEEAQRLEDILDIKPRGKLVAACNEAWIIKDHFLGRDVV